MKLGIDWDAFSTLRQATPPAEAMLNWTSSQEPDERISSMARLMLGTGKMQPNMALLPLSQVNGRDHASNFANYGGLVGITDHNKLASRFAGEKWVGSSPLTSGIGMARVKLTHPFDISLGVRPFPDVEAIVPILSTDLVVSRDRNIFSDYWWAVANYFHVLMVSDKRVRSYHRRDEPMKINYQYTFYGDEWSPPSSNVYAETKSVPAWKLMKAVSAYASTDTVARLSLRSTMRESNSFMRGLGVTAREHFRDRRDIDVQALGVREGGSEPNWLSMQLHNLISHLTREQRKYHLDKALFDMSTAANHVGGTFEKMARSVGDEVPEDMLNPYLEGLNDLWSALSSVAGISVLMAALPPEAGDSMRKMWVESWAEGGADSEVGWW